MADDEEPIQGIDRAGGGYFGVPRPPPDARFPEDPKKHPWLAWQIAVDQAKRGNFEPAARILELYDPKGDYRLNYQSVILIGDAGPSRCFVPIARELESPSKPEDYQVALDFSYALSIRGRLGDAPLILRAYQRHADIKDAEVLHVHLSSMLGRSPGEFQFPSDFDSMEEYSEPLLARYRELCESLGGDEALVFGGEGLGVVRLARRILADLRQPYFLPDLRRRFEACTGIDCSGFFKKGALQPLAAAAIVEEFLHGPAAARYQDGTRYFFGRPVP